MQSLEQDSLEAGQYILKSARAGGGAVPRIHGADPQGEPGTGREGFTQLYRTLLRLREKRIRENLEQIRVFTLEVEEQSNLMDDSSMIGEYNKALNRIDKAIKQQVVLD